MLLQSSIPLALPVDAVAVLSLLFVPLVVCAAASALPKGEYTTKRAVNARVNAADASNQIDLFEFIENHPSDRALNNFEIILALNLRV
jgi:hypothetical protein